MKKLEKYKIAPQAKFVKFKVKHFVEIPTIRYDKAVSPLLVSQKLSSALNVSPPWLLKFSSCPPAWLMTQKSFPPHPRGEGEDTMCCCHTLKVMLKSSSEHNIDFIDHKNKQVSALWIVSTLVFVFRIIRPIILSAFKKVNFPQPQKFSTSKEVFHKQKFQVGVRKCASI